MRPPVTLLAILFLLFAAMTSEARIIDVPGDFETIQAAIDDASVDEVDTVRLADAVYAGANNTNLAINRELVLMSANGAAECIIDCEEAADSRAIFATSSVKVIGLTIKRATANGIRIDNAPFFVIDFCYFTENNGVVAQQSGGAVQIRTSTGTIKNSIFESNSNIGSGGAIVTVTSPVRIEGCTFIENSVERFGGAILLTSNSETVIFNSLFIGNSSVIDGGAIAHSVQSRSIISFCTFIENHANGLGGALYKGSNSVPTITNSIFWGNTADARGNQLAEQVPENGGGIEISYSIVEGGADEGDDQGAGAWGGDEIIDEEPQFVDGRQPEWGLNGFFLDPEESPAIDAGSAGAEELGVNNLFTDPELTVDDGQADIGFHYWIGWYHIVGRLYGRVLDLTDDSPIAGARVATNMGQATLTDDEGNWEIPEALVGVFDVVASKQGFHAVTVEDQELEENGELELVFRLPHGEFRIREELLATEIGFNDSTTIQFTIINDGNGPVHWTASTTLREEDNLPLWEAIRQYETGNEVDDARITGIAFDGESYYVSGADGNEPSKIYVLDNEARLQREFIQPGSARFGMRDLAWDGELLWGVSDGDAIGFTTGGDSITSFRVVDDPSYSITYDPVNELYWVSSTTRDVYSFDREGRQVSSFDNGPLRIYGLAWWGGDPDGASIYIHGSTADVPGPQVFKVNPENGQIIQVAELTARVPANAATEGIEIVENIDPYGVTMLAIYNSGVNGDVFNVWRMSLRDQWAQVEPIEGIVEGGESFEASLNFNSNGFDEGVFHAVAHFLYDADRGSLQIPIEMQVVGGDVHAVRTIQLPRGWSLISSHIQPENDDVRTIMQPLVDAGKLLFMKDTGGRIYAPRLEEPFINMEPWDVTKPYWIKLESLGELRLDGLTVRSDMALHLGEGWNGVAYLPRIVMDPARAFGGIMEAVDIVRDGEGRFMLPRYNFSNLQPCRHGSGYIVRLNRDVEFVWGAEPQNDFVIRPIRLEKTPERFEVPHISGVTMSLLLLAEGRDGEEVAVYAGERLIGGGVIDDGMVGIGLVGDDPTTAGVEGAISGEPIIVKIFGASGSQTVFPIIREGKLSFAADGLIVAELPKVSLPVTEALVEAYPNPFNSSTIVKVALPEAGIGTVALYDIKGSLVRQIYAGQMNAGEHRFTLNGGEMASGVYFLKVESGKSLRTTRLLLMR